MDQYSGVLQLSCSRPDEFTLNNKVRRRLSVLIIIQKIQERRGFSFNYIFFIGGFEYSQFERLTSTNPHTSFIPHLSRGIAGHHHMHEPNWDIINNWELPRVSGMDVPLIQALVGLRRLT